MLWAGVGVTIQSRSRVGRADGIKAQSKKFGQTWWASRWLIALERLVDPGRLSRGRSYARSGQVLNIDITAGQGTGAGTGQPPQAL